MSRRGSTGGVPVQRMSERAFWRRFGKLEHERLEFKSSVHHIGEAVVAMAMTSGGTILVGVWEGPVVRGCTTEQSTFDRIADVAYETQVDLDVRRIEVAGVTVIAIDVPHVARGVVTTSDGRLLRRVGASNRPLRGEGLLQFLSERLAGAGLSRGA